MREKSIKRFLHRNLSSILVIAVVLFFLTLWFGSNILEILRLLQMKNDLQNQIIEKTEVSSQLDEDIKQIGTQGYIERIARSYLGLYYPDEQIVIPVEQNKKEEKSDDSEVPTVISEEDDTIPSEETNEPEETEQVEETETVDEETGE